MFISLILLYSFLFAILAWRNQLLALQITLFALPAYLIRFKLVIPFTLLEVMIIINFIIWFVKNINHIKIGLKNRINNKIQIINYPFYKEMIAILLVGFIGVFFAHFHIQ